MLTNEMQVDFDQIPAHANPTSVGGIGLVKSYPDAVPELFEGHVDEVKVWIDAALTVQEIESLYGE